jgi:cobalt-zinc-cadmium efflux system outer membrane protein
VFRVEQAAELKTLERALRESAPELAEPRGEVSVARAAARQSRLWENPDLAVAWNTLPVGTTNPPDLARPYANIPNYALQVRYPFVVGKRGARVRAADARARASESELSARTRALALEVAAIASEVAASMLREQGLVRLREDANSDLAAARLRLEIKLGSALEVDRLALEAQRAEQQLLSARATRERALRECTVLVGLPCLPFADAAAARAFFARWLDGELASDRTLARRSDLQALRQLEQASNAEAELARATRLPDPTLSLGYTHDRFLVSGAQRNSFNLGVSVPLPLVDRGQARRAAALARAAALRQEQLLRRTTALAALDRLERELAAQRARQRQLSEQLVPNAAQIVSELEFAVRSRLAPISDLIQARRTLDELLLQESESYAGAFDTLLALAAQSGVEP